MFLKDTSSTPDNSQSKHATTTPPLSPYVPPHKLIFKDITKLTTDNINFTNLMKKISIRCHSMSIFLKFYQSLNCHFDIHHVHVRYLGSIDSNNFSEPQWWDKDSDVRTYSKNVICSFLSKEGVFKEDFKALIDALSLTFDGYKVLDILLSQTHAKMLDVWACKLCKPTFSDTLT